MIPWLLAQLSTLNYYDAMNDGSAKQSHNIVLPWMLAQLSMGKYYDAMDVG